MRHRFFLPLLLWTGSIQRSRYSSLRCRLRPIPAPPPPPCRLVRGRGSRQLRIVAMASPPEPPSTTRQARSGLIDGRSRPRDRSVMRARALTGAARSGCGRPGGKSSGHHQTERLAGLDRGRPERVVNRGLLALPSQFCIGRCRTDHQTTAAEGGASRWSYDLPTQDRKVEARRAVLPWPGWTLLCCVKCWLGLEESVELAGDVADQAAFDLTVGPAPGAPSGG
jgi:hypothetical protein